MSDAKKIVSGKYLEYKGKPLVREGDTICYGSMEDKASLIVEIMSYKTEGDMQVPYMVFIQISNPKNPTEIIRQGSKNGMSEALSMGLIWLERALM